MSQILLTTALTALVSSLVGALVGAVVAVAKAQGAKAQERENAHEEEWKAIKSGLRSLLRSDLMSIHHQCVKDGCASTIDKEVLQRTYNSYHALGGNGVATSMFDEAMALPTVDK